MTEEENKYFEDDFIGRWVSGSLSEEEQRKLDIWLKSQPEEKKRFDELKSLWGISGHIRYKEKNLPEWSTMAEKLDMNSQSAVNRYGARNVLWRVVSAAAILLILVGSYWWKTREIIVTVTTDRAETQVVNLPDNSELVLNAATSVTFDRNNFSRRREVTLAGEAFFRVRKNGGPFVVRTDIASVEVLGTNFNIKSRDEFMKIECESGRVAVMSNAVSEKAVILEQGLATSVLRGHGPRQPFRFNMKKAGSWMNGEINFSSAPVPEVIEEIERQFNVRFIQNHALDSILFTGTFNNKDLNLALEILSLSTGFRYSMANDSTVVVK
jgi:ferric-dicitrate binding protein FerR (iron transport regulator)